MSESNMTEKPPKKPRKRKLENGATLHCIASNGNNALNVFETENKLTFSTFSDKKKDFETLTINIKNGKLNIFKKDRDLNNNIYRFDKKIRNITRKPNQCAKFIHSQIKNAIASSGKKIESDGDGGFPF